MPVSSTLKGLVLSAMLLGTVASPLPALADGTTIAAISNTLTNMGFTPKVNQGTVTFDGGRYTVNITLSQDGTLAYFSIYYSVPPEKAAKAPLLKLLNYSDTHQAYAFVTSNAQGVPIFVGFDIQLPGNAMTPLNLRLTTQAVSDAIGDQQALVNPANW